MFPLECGLRRRRCRIPSISHGEIRCASSSEEQRTIEGAAAGRGQVLLLLHDPERFLRLLDQLVVGLDLRVQRPGLLLRGVRVRAQLRQALVLRLVARRVDKRETLLRTSSRSAGPPLAAPAGERGVWCKVLQEDYAKHLRALRGTLYLAYLAGKKQETTFPRMRIASLRPHQGRSSQKLDCE